MKKKYFLWSFKNSLSFFILFYLFSMHSNAVSIQPDSLKVVDLLKKSEETASKDRKNALKIAFSAHDIALKSKQPYLLLVSKQQMGRILFTLGLYKEATNYFLEVLKISEEIQDLEWMGKAYHQLGNIRLVMEDYDQSIHYFNQSEKYLKEFYKDKGGLPLEMKLGIQNNRGLIFTGKKQYSAATQQLRDALQLIQQSKNDSDPILISKLKLHAALGEMYLKMKLYNEAIVEFNSVLEVSNKFNPLFKAMLLNGLGKAYFELKEYNQAVSMFQKGYTLAKKENGFSHLKHLSEGLHKSYEKLQVKDSALVYLKIFNQYEDSLELKKTAEKMIEHELKTQLNKDKVHLVKKHNKEKIIYSVLISILVIVVLYFSYRIIKQRNKITEVVKDNQEFQEVVEESNAEKSKLKEQVEETEKKLAIMSIQKIEADELIDNLAKTLPKIQWDADSENSENLEKIRQSLKTRNNRKSISDFEFYFERLHIGFFERLQQKYPDLTANERRLCAFLKLQMNSKEIASVTGQTVRAIEIARTRLRKKLGITNAEVHLNDFFNHF